MSSNNPMDRFVTGYGRTMHQMDELVDSGIVESSLRDGGPDFVLALQELQMTNWATGIATTRRHGLLKKILTEIR